MKHILVTGFDPFDNAQVNPAWEAVSLLKGVDKIQIPTVFYKSWNTLETALNQNSYDGILMVGLAGVRSGFSFEQIALNYMDARIPDNEGQMPKDEPIDPNEPLALFSKMDNRRLCDLLNSEGIEAHLSYSAGTFVCNYLFFKALSYIQKNNIKIPVGFVHVPYMTEFGGTPSMPRETILRGLKFIVDNL